MTRPTTPAPAVPAVPTVRVLLADDQPLVRAALEMVITEAEDLEVVGEAGNGAEAVRLAEELRPDVVVMDIRMPVLDGIEATRRVTAGPSPARVVVLTTFDEDENVYAALHAGASGFLVKDMALDDILDAIRVVAAGEALLSPSVTRRLIAEFTARPAPAAAPASVPAPSPPGAGRLAAITEREREILTLVGRGLANPEIATELVLSPATVKTYITRLLTKLAARDRVQLVILAYESGLVPLTAAPSPDRR
ncbi:response regulator [Kitasatospora purpeofusca]|uniref:response regulator n=1 Tax=Kitasatospora purpeofusca TaxID=67352 RepID=UPI00225B70C3|nr:response regulator transcription factor [Kitasatospora purpeofusca]MCX4755696.1 response regulator transcription factor [Kitasatospora purpeofusca]WSR36442.1 response regulator transcription factor [Kitasatospora purpeofusca]